MSVYLPEEVMVEILKRLPVKSVVKCRLVCKNWNNLINSPSFISTHLQTSLSKLHNHLLLLHKSTENVEEGFFLHFDNEDCDEYKKLRFPDALKDRYNHVAGSCNGLVCLYHCKRISDPIIWNPSIQRYITLPTCLTDNDDFVSGFGFDSRTNDYKLFKVAFEEGKTSTEAYLFSLNQNYWKKVTASFPQYAMQRQNSTFVNGAFHWVGYQRENDGRFRNMILGFNISTEQSFVMRFPENLIGLDPMDLLIMKYEVSSIAVVRSDWVDDKKLELWVMKKYGVVGSWTKVLHLTNQSETECLPEVLGFRMNGEVLMEVDDAELVSLDLNCQRMNHLQITSKFGFLYVESYVESLVLLDKGVDDGCFSYENHA